MSDIDDDQPKIAVTLDAEGQTATLDFLPASGAQGRLSLSLNKLTAFIKFLGRARATLVAKQPLPILANTEVDAIFNTRWLVERHHQTDGSVLTFYHPSFGPVAFVIPRDQVAEFVRPLNAHLQIQPSPEGKTN